jgi:hypothetical protein
MLATRTTLRSAPHDPVGPVKPTRYGSRYPSAGPTDDARACLLCNAPLSSSRAIYCSAACKRLAFRLRRQQHANPDVTLVRKQLKRQRLLVAHTIYECPSCDERFVGDAGVHRVNFSAEPLVWAVNARNATTPSS